MSRAFFRVDDSRIDSYRADYAGDRGPAFPFLSFFPALRAGTISEWRTDTETSWESAPRNVPHAITETIDVDTHTNQAYPSYTRSFQSRNINAITLGLIQHRVVIQCDRHKLETTQRTHICNIYIYKWYTGPRKKLAVYVNNNNNNNNAAVSRCAPWYAVQDTARHGAFRWWPRETLYQLLHNRAREDRSVTDNEGEIPSI